MPADDVTIAARYAARRQASANSAARKSASEIADSNNNIASALDKMAVAIERIADRLDSWSYQQTPEHQTLLRVGEGA